MQVTIKMNSSNLVHWGDVLVAVNREFQYINKNNPLRAGQNLSILNILGLQMGSIEVGVVDGNV